jgi:hypothetical protein
MAFHVALYSAAIATAAANTQVNQLGDAVIATSVNGYLVNGFCPNIMRVVAVGNILNRAQLSSPSIRKYTPFDLNPVNIGTVIESPARMLHFEDSPFPLSVNEELDAYVTNSAVTSTQTTVAVWFCDGPIRPVNNNNIFTVHWTASTTLTANAWTAVTMSLDNGIPSGTFAIVGSRQKSAGALFHRFVPRGGSSTLRPGTTSVQAFDNFATEMDRYGNLGQWMQFTNTTPPQIEIFSGSADSSEEGFLDLLQVG